MSGASASVCGHHWPPSLCHVEVGGLERGGVRVPATNHPGESKEPLWGVAVPAQLTRTQPATRAAIMAAAAFLSNATIVRTLPLQFPAYGFEGIFHRPPPPETPKPGSHFQHTLRISGTVPPGSSFSRYHLKVDMFVRGALWRTQTHALCSSINDDPEDEVLRRCASGDGPFTAMVWAFVPSNRPSFEEGEMGIAQGVRLLRQAGRDHAAQLRVATHYLARMNVCNLSQPLPDRFVGAECNKSLSKLLLAHADGTQPMRHTKGKVTPDALMRSYAWKHDPRGGKSDLYDVDWRTIGTMFVLAALSLPQPFAIVRSRSQISAAHYRTEPHTDPMRPSRPTRFRMSAPSPNPDCPPAAHIHRPFGPRLTLSPPPPRTSIGPRVHAG